MTAATTDLEDRVLEALCEVMDPCSQASGTPMSLPDMGLVAGVTVTDGDDGARIDVTLRVTAPQCLFAPLFAVEAEDLIRALPGVVEAVVTVSDELDWTEDDMSPRARSQLAAVREAKHERTTVVGLPAPPAPRRN